MPITFFLITGSIKFFGYLAFLGSFFWWWGPRRSYKLSALDDAGCIAEDRFCDVCGYNVRGLQLKGICPECGKCFGINPSSISPKGQSNTLPKLLIFTLARTVIGLALGGLYWHVVGDPGRGGILSAWAGLAPIRFAEWLVVISVFRKCFKRGNEQVFLPAALGTLITFLLDVPVIFEFCVANGGPPC